MFDISNYTSILILTHVISIIKSNCSIQKNRSYPSKFLSDSIKHKIIILRNYK
jgi:hypothetical protein